MFTRVCELLQLFLLRPIDEIEHIAMAHFPKGLVRLYNKQTYKPLFSCTRHRVPLQACIQRAKLATYRTRYGFGSLLGIPMLPMPRMRDAHSFLDSRADCKRYPSSFGDFVWRVGIEFRDNLAPEPRGIAKSGRRVRAPGCGVARPRRRDSSRNASSDAQSCEAAASWAALARGVRGCGAS
jgi:hypothetical protein